MRFIKASLVGGRWSLAIPALVRAEVSSVVGRWSLAIPAYLVRPGVSSVVGRWSLAIPAYLVRVEYIPPVYSSRVAFLKADWRATNDRRPTTLLKSTTLVKLPSLPVRWLFLVKRLL